MGESERKRNKLGRGDGANARFKYGGAQPRDGTRRGRVRRRRDAVAANGAAPLAPVALVAFRRDAGSSVDPFRPHTFLAHSLSLSLSLLPKRRPLTAATTAPPTFHPRPNSFPQRQRTVQEFITRTRAPLVTSGDLRDHPTVLQEYLAPRLCFIAAGADFAWPKSTPTHQARRTAP